MQQKSAEGGQTGPHEVAAYIAVLTADMVRLARNHNLTELAYLLDLARLEALQRSQTSRGGGSKRIA